MSRTILALALASSVSALLPAKLPGRVRSAPLASSTLLSMRSRPFMLESAPTNAETGAPLPTISGVDGLLFQALATVCGTLMSDELDAIFKPVPEDAEPDDKLDQPYQLKKRGGWTVDGESAMDVFKSKLASYGTVIDGITDWHGEYEAAVPPFAALIVQPPKKDGKDPKPILILAWRGSHTVLDWVNDFAGSPTLSTRWSSETKDIRAHGAYVNLVENTFSLHEDAIVDLIEKYEVERAFITGHSLAGGMANVAHLIVRGQLKKEHSPWAKLDGKVTWLACTFAAPQTIVRKYEENNIPPPSLINDLDGSSFNIVYGCDIVPRPGMLGYVGNFMEIVVPNIVDEDVLGNIPYLGGLLKYVPLGKMGVGAVKLMKKDGSAYVLSQLTHVGKVAYQRSEDKEYMYLAPEAKIREVLDVKDKTAFLELWEPDSSIPGRVPKDYMQSLADAHGHKRRFEFGAK